MIELPVLAGYCSELLRADAFDDYCPNGLQVDAGNPDIRRLVTGVTACRALIRRAADLEADLILVHHGYFWKGEPAPLTGVKGRRVRALMRQGISLLAFHLPLDAHPALGNNRQLGLRLGWDHAAPLDPEQGLLWAADLDPPQSPSALAARIAGALGREPLVVRGGDEVVSRIGWCTGAAHSWIERAAEAGLGAFISGEISEPTVHLARELGVHYFSAGHHATERFGVRALGDHLAERFQIEHRFVDIPNPV